MLSSWNISDIGSWSNFVWSASTPHGFIPVTAQNQPPFRDDGVNARRSTQSYGQLGLGFMGRETPVSPNGLYLVEMAF